MNKEELAEIAGQIKTQDNLATADPLFCVFQKSRLYGFRQEHADKYEWIDPDEGNADTDPRGRSDEEMEAAGHEKVYYKEINLFVNAHFTRTAAKEHIRRNGHNLQEPFVYVTSLFRCNEMINIRKFLAAGGQQEEPL